MNTSRLPVGVNPRSPARCPSWKIHTIAPNVAVRLSTFSTRALIGTRRCRSSGTAARTSRARRARSPAAGVRSRRPSSRRTARTGPRPRTRTARPSTGTSSTSRSPSLETGSTSGTTESHGAARRPRRRESLRECVGREHVHVVVGGHVVARRRVDTRDAVERGEVPVRTRRGLLRRPPESTSGATTCSASASRLVEVLANLVVRRPRRDAGGTTRSSGSPRHDAEERDGEHEQDGGDANGVGDGVAHHPRRPAVPRSGRRRRRVRVCTRPFSIRGPRIASTDGSTTIEANAASAPPRSRRRRTIAGTASGRSPTRRARCRPLRR